MNLNQVTLPSSNIRDSIRFYRGMGFTLIVDSPDYARFACPDGDATFSVHSADAISTNSGVVVYFELPTVDELDERASTLAAAGYLFDQMPEDQTWLWREARLRDPDNNVICLFFAGTNRHNPPWRVTH